MATTLAPSLGNGLLFTQQGVGASPGYDMVDLRRAATAGLQEGVYAAGSFEVTQRAAGSAMFVDIAASTAENGIAAVVQGDSVTGQGLYVIGPHSTFVTEAIAAAHATLPRVDRVVLEVQDNQHDASGANAARVRVISGTATAAATLDNLNGAAAVPSNCLLLADVLVAATDTAIGNTEIRDRRKWARGAYYSAAGDGTGNHSTVSTSYVAIAAGYSKRIECSGAPIEITFECRLSNTTAGDSANVRIESDGASIGSSEVEVRSSVAGDPFIVTVEARFTPAAGSHVFRPVYKAVTGGTAFINNLGDLRPSLTIKEVIRPNTANNVTTSG